MSRRVKHAALVFVVVFAAAQVVRPERASPATDVSRSIRAHAGMADGLAPILERSCGDCHSNATPPSAWYTQVAPLSWLMAHEVAEGRKALNFSEWAAYSPAQQRTLLAASCDAAKSGRMPGPYTFFKADSRLSAAEVQTICGAARQADAHAPGAAR
jgi:Haem-binding domain